MGSGPLLRAERHVARRRMTDGRSTNRCRITHTSAHPTRRSRPPGALRTPPATTNDGGSLVPRPPAPPGQTPGAPSHPQPRQPASTPAGVDRPAHTLNHQPSRAHQPTRHAHHRAGPTATNQPVPPPPAPATPGAPSPPSRHRPTRNHRREPRLSRAASHQAKFDHRRGKPPPGQRHRSVAYSNADRGGRGA